jgi:purine-binding chemotaxis protein CheW
MNAATMNSASNFNNVQEERGEQYLTFQLAGEEYGIHILRVQEIRGWERVTRVPNTPDYMRGVVNLRGSIVPVFDLRRQFKLQTQVYSKDTVVIVLRANKSDGGIRSIGVVVDGVSDVLNATETDISHTPEFGARVSTEWIAGLASSHEKMIMLLDVDKLFDEEERQLSGEVENA